MDRRKTDRRTNEGRELYVFDIQDLFDILLKRKALLIGFMLMVFIPGVMFIIAKPAKYQAIATAMMDEPDYLLTDLQSAMAPQKTESAFETQISLLKSQRLIQKTIADVSNAKGDTAVTEAQIKQFLQSFNASPVGKSQVVSVSYQAKDPKLAADIVNTHLQNFIDYQIENKKEQIEVINEWLNKQVESLKADSQKKGQAIQDFKGESGILLGPDAENLIYQQISELTQQLVPVETQKITLQAKMDALTKGSKNSLPEILGSNTIMDLKTQLSTANGELKALSAQYGPSHPQRQAAQKRVSQIYGAIAQEEKNIRSSLALELESATKQEELLHTRIEELNKQADEMQDKSLTMEGLQGELEANRKILAVYMDKFQELKTRMELNHSDVRIVAKAEVPAEPFGPGKLVLGGVLAIFSVIFALGAVLLLELVDRGIENENDIKRGLNLKLLGALPKTKSPLGGIAGKAATTYIEELKRIYLALAARKIPQTILITSTTSGEGKSTVALSLAQYLSSINAKVIIVDVDGVSPSLATLAGTDLTPGFAELMAGATDYTKAVKRGGGTLPVIPSGDRDHYNVDILASGNFAKMLDTLKSQYDYVILDCAPALITTDAEVIASLVDTVILVISWAKTPKKQLRKVAEILRQHARDVPNVILNKRG